MNVPYSRVHFEMDFVLYKYCRYVDLSTRSTCRDEIENTRYSRKQNKIKMNINSVAASAQLDERQEDLYLFTNSHVVIYASVYSVRRIMLQRICR